MLRGILTSLGDWWGDPQSPGEQCHEAVLAVWCPFCADYHHHGWDPADAGQKLTHRWCHCSDPASPFHATGYRVGVVCQGKPGYTSHVVVPGVAIRRPKPPARSPASKGI
ncbi:MAG: hypothetical protein ACYC35_01140 [Pirellulales bacterium]